MKFCSTKLFNIEELWLSTPPIISECLQLSILLIPCVALWLYTLITLLREIFFGHQRLNTPNQVPFTAVFVVKIILHIIIAGCPLIDIIDLAISSHKQIKINVDIISYFTPSLLILTVILSVVILFFNHRRIQHSDQLSFFWLFVIFCGIPRLYQFIQNARTSSSSLWTNDFWTFTVSWGLSLVLSILIICVPHLKVPPPQNNPKACPETTVGIFSRMSYSWLDRIVYMAYKGELSEDTAFDVREEDSVEVNLSKFQKFWEEEKQKALKANLATQEVQSRRATGRTFELNNDLPSTSSQQNLLPEPEVEVIDPKEDTNVMKPSLIRVLFKIFGPTMLLSWSFKFFYDLLIYSSPFLLRILLTYFQDTTEATWHGYIYAFLFVIVGLLTPIFAHWGDYIGFSVGMRITSSLIAVIYRKALTLTVEARTKSTIGEIVNLMSVDSERICEAACILWFTWSTLLTFGVGIALLYNELGPSIFSGLAILLLFVPVNGILMKFLSKFEEKEMEWKDQRMKLLSDVFNGIKILKLYAWELSFKKKVCEIRDTEIKFSKRVNFLWSSIIVFWDCVPFLIMLTTFLTYVYSAPDNILTAEKAFVSLTIFNMLRYPMVILPWGITCCVNAAVSIKRLQNYLRGEDIDMSGIYMTDTPAKPNEVAIGITNGVFAWKSEGAATLNNLQLEIGAGKLVAVVGKVGVGKSSLISAILGDMLRRDGRIAVKGRIAYVPQSAWIQNMTLKNNILFGQAMLKEQYDRVIEACALEPDLDILPGRDDTEIGERGINVSGGQKQRISLARAVYQDRDIYLLDDPLSAVDAHVGQHLFNQVIGPNGILKDKTRLLVTHGIHWLPDVDEIIVIDENGHISERGTYQELLTEDHNFAEVLRSLIKDIDPSLVEVEDPPIEDEEPRDLGVPIPVQGGLSGNAAKSAEHGHKMNKTELLELMKRQASLPGDKRLGASSPPRVSPCDPAIIDQTHRKAPNLPRAVSHEATRPDQVVFHRSNSQAAKDGPVDPVIPGSQLVDTENMEGGRVTWAAYKSYILGRGILLTAVMVISFTLFSGLQVMSVAWIQEMTQDPVLVNMSYLVDHGYNITEAERDLARDKVDYYMGIYAVYGVGLTILVGIFGISQALGIIRASKVIHLTLLDRILHAPMSFFDTTPTGRLLNRFSKDMEVVDHTFPGSLSDFIVCLLTVLASLAAVSFITPWFVLVLIFVTIIYSFIQKFSIAISRDSRRLYSVSKSPIFAQFSETIQGASVIRAFGHQDRFCQLSNKAINNNARFYFLKMTSNRWQGLRLEVLSGLVVLGSIVFALLERGVLSAGLVGLSVSYALNVTENLNWLVRQITEIETDAVSLERISEYSNVDSEASWDDALVELPPDWPSQGHVEFIDYSTRYRDGLPLVLDTLTADIAPGERIGIVGRTGAGKSSLTLSLFRLIESAGGAIQVDGVKLDKIGLHNLRSKITILPQEPVLFVGNIRTNLDPLSEYNDDMLWSVLTQSHLVDWVRNLPEGLDYECGESGNNLSVGQRQLICLARALLRKSKLLILDEATAAVDLDTDRIIMSTLREEFEGSTILIIAHRLPTVMDADKVMVLDKGRILEFAPPSELLANQESYFYGLAKDAGLV